MLYPLAYPPLQFYAATAPFVNAYQPFVIEGLANMVNGTIKAAVTDEAEAARAAGKGDRLFVVTPPRFRLGLLGEDQVIHGKPGFNCLTRALSNKVDGPSNQSKALQVHFPSSDYDDVCPSTEDSKIWFESLDGAHLSKSGHTQYKNLLATKVKEIGLPLPKPSD
jgi:hypothetical protein